MKKWIKDGEFYQEGSSIIIDERRYFAPLTDEQMRLAGYVEWTSPITEQESIETPIDQNNQEQQEQQNSDIIESEIDLHELLEYKRHEKLIEIDNYDHSIYVNSFTINGQEMWLTAEKRQQLLTQINAYEFMGNEMMTKWFNGIEFTFPISSWKQMLMLLEIYAGDALNVTEAHKAAIQAMDNIEDIDNFDITQGYPEKLIF